MVGSFLLFTAVVFLLIVLHGNRKGIFAYALIFFILQALLCGYLLSLDNKITFWKYFTVDPLSRIIFALESAIGLITVIASYHNIDQKDTLRQKIYYISLIALDILLLGVIFSNDLVVNWIFLEATTLAVAAISYHHRSFTAAEATWKYIFTSSVGIAVAYMGILLLGSRASSLDYSSLADAVKDISPLILKISFLLIFVGYSIKLEVVPLYNSAIDVNHVSPSPASGFISSVLLGGATVSLIRIYGVMSSSTETFAWIRHVLMFAGVMSILFAAIYIGRTSNYKRLLSYSTVENSGIAMLGLALGGIGVYVALLHTFFHMILKSLLFIQIGIVGKIYGTLTIGRHREYMKADATGMTALILGIIAITAFPPSVLFITELTIFKSLVSSGLWWVMVIVAVLLLITMYWLFEKVLLMVYNKKTQSLPTADLSEKRPLLSSFIVFIILSVFVIGFTMPEVMTSYISSIAESIIK